MPDTHRLVRPVIARARKPTIPRQRDILPGSATTAPTSFRMEGLSGPRCGLAAIRGLLRYPAFLIYVRWITHLGFQFRFKRDSGAAVTHCRTWLAGSGLPVSFLLGDFESNALRSSQSAEIAPLSQSAETSRHLLEAQFPRKFRYGSTVRASTIWYFTCG